MSDDKMAQQIRVQIRKLQTQVKKIARRRNVVLRRIIKQMGRDNISLAELRGAMGGPRKRGAATKRAAGKKRAKVAVKYRDDKGNRWTGRGRTPLWLQAAEKAGKKRADFAV